MSTTASLQRQDSTANIIAANIRAEVARAGLTDAQFAARFGLTPMAVSRRLSGATPFTTTEVKRAALLFGVSVEALFTEHRRRDDENGPASEETGPETVRPPRLELGTHWIRDNVVPLRPRGRHDRSTGPKGRAA